MSKHKIRYILPLLAVMASAACVGAAGSSDKAENKLDMKYKDLFRRAATKDSKLHGLSKQYFINVRSKWKAYKEELCSDPTITTDLKTPSDKILYLCDVQQTQHHLKALERF